MTTQPSFDDSIDELSADQPSTDSAPTDRPSASSDKPVTDKLSSASEYALIFGAGATAAMSLAAQQVAAASVPVTALVAIGLLNRRRLDQRIKEGEPVGPSLEQKTTRQADITAQHQVSSRPSLDPMPAQPRPTPSLGPAPIAGPAIRFSNRRAAAKENLQAIQQTSLESIGAHLRQIRQEMNLSLQDVHQQTYIQRYALKAIESGDLSSLPEPFYVRAFIRKYATALNLQGDEIASQFPVT